MTYIRSRLQFVSGFAFPAAGSKAPQVSPGTIQVQMICAVHLIGGSKCGHQSIGQIQRHQSKYRPVVSKASTEKISLRRVHMA